MRTRARAGLRRPPQDRAQCAGRAWPPSLAASALRLPSALSAAVSATALPRLLSGSLSSSLERAAAEVIPSAGKETRDVRALAWRTRRSSVMRAECSRVS